MKIDLSTNEINVLMDIAKKIIEAMDKEQKQKDRGMTVGPKVFADTIGLGAEVTAPVFPGLKLLRAYAKKKNLPVDTSTLSFGVALVTSNGKNSSNLAADVVMPVIRPVYPSTSRFVIPPTDSTLMVSVEPNPTVAIPV